MASGFIDVILELSFELILGRLNVREINCSVVLKCLAKSNVFALKNKKIFENLFKKINLPCFLFLTKNRRQN